ncbi:MAG: hypothetical protein JFR38_05240 [Muribaculaceae bacterium]|mgnify:FL=1|nr:hypothetical protein [Muribaculaceae bacterium]
MPSPRTARSLAIALVIATGIAVLGTGAARMLRPRPDHADPDRSRYPIAGIDISAHNGIVDFGRAAREGGISFVYLKASEGDTFRDAAFENNYANAREAGLSIGAYHFFRFDCEGWRQAANMLRAIGPRQLDLPPAIDLEEWRNHPGAVTGEVVVQLHGMIDYLRAAGHEPVIYTNKGSHRRFVRGRFDDIGLWISSFTDPPISRADWLFWQHSHSGRIPGVPGPVDLNTFCGDSADWHSALRHWRTQ